MSKSILKKIIRLNWPLLVAVLLEFGKLSKTTDDFESCLLSSRSDKIWEVKRFLFAVEFSLFTNDCLEP